DRAPRGTRWIGHLVSMLILIVVLGTFFAGIGLAARQVVDKFPASFTDMGQVIEQTATPDGGEGASSGADSAEDGGAAAGGRPSTAGGGSERGDGGVFGQLQGWKGELGELLKERGTGYAGTVLNRMASFLASLVLVLFLTLLLLIEAPHWRDKARTIFTRKEESQWMQALEQTARNLRVFVVAKTAVGLTTTLLYVGWMAVMGLDLLLVWGLLTFLFSYVPVIGSVVAGLIAAGYAFYQLDIYWAVVTALGLLAIEQVMGNFVEPRFLGRQLALSSFVVLASLLLWGWIWGIAGAVLATPLLIFILNVSAHVGSLRPLAVLLSDKGEDSVRTVHAEEEA
ncbi:MAG TPA: AI-2E family transporter, partial [Thermohalobaculum sp.]|nr:AI-2E family transporter [Thermohalobaculum sp.]